MIQRPKSACGNDTATVTPECPVHNLWRFAPRQFRIEGGEQALHGRMDPAFAR
jgi:hypothetical protein